MWKARRANGVSEGETPSVAICSFRLGSPPLPVDESILIGRGGDGLGGDGGRQKAAKVIVGLIVLQVSYTWQVLQRSATVMVRGLVIFVPAG